MKLFIYEKNENKFFFVIFTPPLLLFLNDGKCKKLVKMKSKKKPLMNMGKNEVYKILQREN